MLSKKRRDWTTLLGVRLNKLLVCYKGTSGQQLDNSGIDDLAQGNDSAQSIPVPKVAACDRNSHTEFDFLSGCTQGIDVKVLKSIADMEACKEEWEELYRNASYKWLYAEPHYCLNWLYHFGYDADIGSPPQIIKENLRAQPLLVLARQRGRLDLVLPLCISLTPPSHLAFKLVANWTLPPSEDPQELRERPAHLLRGLINAHSDYANILFRQGCDEFAKDVIAALIPSLGEQFIHLGFAPESSPPEKVLHSALASILVPVSTKVRRNLRMRFNGTFDQYLLSRPSLRKSVHGARRRLERDFGPISVELWTGAEALTKGFPAFVDIDGKSWKAVTPGGQALINAPLVRDYYYGLTERFSRTGRAYVWGLLLGGKVAAVELTFESQGVLYGYKLSYDESFSPKGRCKPGFVLRSMVLERAWHSFAAFDFMSDWLHKEWGCEDENEQSVLCSMPRSPSDHPLEKAEAAPF